MNILLISNMYPSAKHPGFGVFIKNFEEAIAERGANFDLAVIRGKQTSKFGKIAIYIAFTLRIYKLIITKKYDVIYVHYLAHSLLPLIPISPFIKSKLIVNAHGEDLLPRTLVERTIFRINKKLIQKSSLIVVPSDFFKSIAASLFPSKKIYVSPSGGINLRIFYPSHEKTSEDFFTLGYVSRIDLGKGWDTLLDAIHELTIRSPDLKLKVLFVGNGTQLTEFHQRVRELNLCDKINYLGPIDQKDLPAIYTKFDAFIFPTKLPESLGLVGLEALACGIPAICSSIGGIQTYMQNGINGYTFPPGNPIDLAHSIEKYLKLCPLDKLEMKKAARDTATRYDRDVIADQMIKTIRDTITYEN